MQKEALRRIRRQSGTGKANGSPKSTHEDRLLKERTQLEYESDELAATLQAQLRATIKRTDSGTGTVPQNVERMLEKDDRLLDGLEKVLPYLTADDDTIDSKDEVHRLCQALKTYTSAEIRSRIDTAYLDAASAASNHANGVYGRANKMQDQYESLRAELEELCREIDGLSTMAVDSQYRNPIAQASEIAKLDTEVTNSSWAEYMASTLQYLAARLDLISEHSHDQQEHAKAAKAISAILEEVLAMSAKKGTSPEPGSNPRSPVKRAQTGLKPLRLVQANLSDAQDPVSQTLRQLDVRVGDTTDSLTLSQQLLAAANDKEDQLSNLRISSERSMADQIAQSLAGADLNLQRLLDAVFVNSTHGSIHMESKDVRAGTQDLETQTQDLGERMRDIDMDMTTKDVQAKQRRILEQLAKR